MNVLFFVQPNVTMNLRCTAQVDLMRMTARCQIPVFLSKVIPKISQSMFSSFLYQFIFSMHTNVNPCIYPHLSITFHFLYNSADNKNIPQCCHALELEGCWKIWNMSVTGNSKFTKYITNIVWQALIHLSIIDVVAAKPDPLVVTVLVLTKSKYH